MVSQSTARLQTLLTVRYRIRESFVALYSPHVNPSERWPDAYSPMVWRSADEKAMNRMASV